MKVCCNLRIVEYKASLLKYNHFDLLGIFKLNNADKSLKFMLNEIVFYPLHKLADLIKNNKITSKELIAVFYEHILKNNKDINCITDLKPISESLEEADLCDNEIGNGYYKGCLHGIPITIKDTFNVKNLISSNGYPPLKKNIALSDAFLVKKLKDSGAIIIGKTNLPFLAIDWISQNQWFGKTNNPYDLTRVPGGSSGGSAASVASGFSPIELGSDAGGSVRVPAHFCGVCSLRPTDGLLSNDGQFDYPGKPKGLRYITVPGPIARNIKDLKIVFDTLFPDETATNQVPLPVKDTLKVNKKLTIAYSKTLFDTEVDAEYQEVFERLLTTLKQQGHELVEAQPVIDLKESCKNWAIITGFDFGIKMPGIPLESFALQLFIRLKYRNTVWAKGMQLGISGDTKAFAKALNYRDELINTFNVFFSTYDTWLTPVSSDCAFKHQRTGKPFKINKKLVKYTDALANFNFPTAVAGHPICVIPIGIIKHGMPVGIQIHGKRWHDKNLLDIAEVLEKNTDGYQIPSRFSGMTLKTE